ncbi:hypothetical protein PVL29_015206 [Vitis rotundifolia]|uniref:TCP domain-containing protein n=1 Tax=Vitis rotundifolia TaxID=103349 RepID=A0AA38ZBY4_VITRO|nr:hypothetical protein PVL29_015206 [Vitis rotundifolia]
MKSAGGGEIVQVQGGHIVRSTGRKDRHSKVYTAKGPRDRRVRLSAHTAIQFYDVQDRLGYDRPSKAVDWLIKKAKSAIDKLAELPPWHPIAQDPNASAGTSDIGMAQQSQESNYVFPPLGGGGGAGSGGGVGGENPSNDSAFIAPPLDSDSIADTMKSFFPTSSGTSSINYQNYPPDSNHHNEDLCLSLHSFQDPDGESNHKNLFASAAQVGYETNFQRMVSWGGGGGDSESRGGFGFMFNSPPMPMPQPQPPTLLSQGSEFSQRGPLQSSFAPAIRAWNELPIASGAMHQSSLSDGRFVPDGIPGFRIPARIQGEEEHSMVSDRPSSSSPNSHH